MTIEELKQECRKAIDRQNRFKSAGIQLVSPDNKRPLPIKGFPRAELLCSIKPRSVWLYDARKLLKALERINE